MSTSSKTLRIYWQHTMLHKKLFTLLSIGVPIAQLVEDFLAPYFMSRILTTLAISQRNGQPLNFGDFTPYIIGITLAEIFHTLFWKIVVVWLWKLEERTMNDLNMTAFKQLMRMSHRFFTNRFGGSLVSQTNKFVGSYERLADTLVWNVYKLFLSFVFTIAILARQATLFVIGLLFFSTIYVLLLWRVKKGEITYNEEWSSSETKRTGQLADAITNMPAVKAFAHEDLEIGLFQKRADAVTGASLKTMAIVLKNEIYTTGVQRLINFTSIFASLWLAVQGRIEVGVIYLVLTYTTGILRRLWDLNNTFRNFNRVFGDARDMTEILQIEPEIKDPTNPEPAHMTRGRVEFVNVGFKYPQSTKDKYLFKNMNLRIKPGEKIGLVGTSGGGKTTLTSLLLRLMDIQEGKILIDGQDITQVKQSNLREHIAYVPQEPLLFHRSLMDNIRYGQLDASDKHVIAVSKMANAHEFINKLPDGYETFVGERGTKLSGGQRQRVAIARAMLKNAPLLVLDEATSALDSESEVLIQDALWKLMEGRTAIVIAHRLSTIQKMDRILVLHEGKIVEEGSHRDLIAQKGKYAELWNHQSGGFMED